ncbi:polysaccharide lyase family 7 protein [Wocania ichthyoenteri]|uniref:polysaccharide lyase family 7 protein n=1 Tax=Wocania ichthyoenteri TaxID=1230531 RepID=UPI0006914C03|nr:polysaccharide lyase family 7 protein [Wocania ichthyoenteri]
MKKIKYISHILKPLYFIVVFGVLCICCSKNTEIEDRPVGVYEEEKEEEPVTPTYNLPSIDLNNWKVTLPIGNPTEVKPPEIIDYATNETLKPFFYNDSVNGALVFYTYPGASTTNSSYSRTELRELMNPSDGGKTNWTFPQGGNMKGALSMDEISKDSQGNYHRTIIMQIHGRLTNEQRDLIGEDDNNAPPMLKIYWNNGKVRVKTKELKDLNASDTEILYTSSWKDDDGHTFSEEVGFDKFTLEVKVESGKMEVILNDKESVVYDNVHIQKWNVFENYFKAGNYLVTTQESAFARVKYYKLEVTH